MPGVYWIDAPSDCWNARQLQGAIPWEDVDPKLSRRLSPAAINAADGLRFNRVPASRTSRRIQSDHFIIGRAIAGG